MQTGGFDRHGSSFVLRMLAKEYGKYNKGRNRILTGAVCLCVAALTMIFGTASGKIEAESEKAVRTAGTAASIRIEDADRSLYEQARFLSYIKKIGRNADIGPAFAGERELCRIQLLDEDAWEELVSPAYTDICGRYPKEAQEIMLSVKTLEALGIEAPQQGMKIALTVEVGLFRREEEEFSLSGWYTGFADALSAPEPGYISEEKYREWGYDIRRKSDILLCQSDGMGWQETEERMYEDLGKDTHLRITVHNTAAYEAVNRLTGSYGLAALGALAILSGMFFLICNVMQISMAGDIRQMGLLHAVGATRKQICGVYLIQIGNVLIRGTVSGIVLSAAALLMVLPRISGAYSGLRIFRPGILAAAAVFTGLLTVGVSAGVIYHMVNVSCAESMNYTGLKGRKAGKEKRIRLKLRRRSAAGELWYMAWQNLTRYRTRFLLTVLSLFLGMEVLLGTVVITKGSDYIHVIAGQPDFRIAGQFSALGREAGYGSEWKSRDAGEDPMETKGDNFALLHDNMDDEFSPISPEVRERLLSLDGVKREGSHVTEGAYMVFRTSKKAIAPLTDGSEGNGEEMIEGGQPDVIQILSDEELAALEEYVNANHLAVDIGSLKDGTGVAILHDHRLSPVQEEFAGEVIKEPVYFCTMRGRKQSEAFLLSGYLDNRADGFPRIRQTWHGSEGGIYFLVSERGFARLPVGKKTLYMELNVDAQREPEIKNEIQDIISAENSERSQQAEAGIFCISRSDLLMESKSYIQGNRLLLGSISIVLLFAGLMNYFNVTAAGIFSRRKEFAVMEAVGMTKWQKRRLLEAEGLYYCLITAILLLTIGSGGLKLIRTHMERRLSYFVFGYPAGWTALLLGCLAGVCLLAVNGLLAVEDCEQ